MTQSKIILLVLGFILTVSCGPKIQTKKSDEEIKSDNSNIIGKWISTRTETEDGNNIAYNGVPYAHSIDLLYTKDSVTQYLFGIKNRTIQYHISRDTLFTKYNEYNVGVELIEQLSESELILLDTLNQPDIGRLRSYYKKER